MEISLYFLSTLSTSWEKWPRGPGARKWISISNRSQVIHKANTEPVVSPKWNMFTSLVLIIPCMLKLPSASCNLQLITWIGNSPEKANDVGRNPACLLRFLERAEEMVRQFLLLLLTLLSLCTQRKRFGWCHLVYPHTSHLLPQPWKANGICFLVCMTCWLSGLM